MIVFWFLTIVLGLFEKVLALCPVIAVPAAFIDAHSTLSRIFAYGAELSAWFPLGLAIQMAGVLLACQLGGGFIKLGRIVLSLFTGGGGSA